MKKGYKFKVSNAKLDFPGIANWSCLTKGLPVSCNLEKHTPLFLYVMREAATIGKGQRLGPVGSAILLEVFGNMFVHCKTFLTATGENGGPWEPNPCVVRGQELTLADFVAYATGAS